MRVERRPPSAAEFSREPAPEGGRRSTRLRGFKLETRGGSPSPGLRPPGACAPAPLSSGCDESGAAAALGRRILAKGRRPRAGAAPQDIADSSLKLEVEAPHPAFDHQVHALRLR